MELLPYLLHEFLFVAQHLSRIKQTPRYLQVLWCPVWFAHSRYFNGIPLTSKYPAENGTLSIQNLL